jgi:hypothetical protein
MLAYSVNKHLGSSVCTGAYARGHVCRPLSGYRAIQGVHDAHFNPVLCKQVCPVAGECAGSPAGRDTWRLAPLRLCLPVGKKAGDAKKQCLFLPFIQAVSVVCTGQGGGDGCLNRSQARRLRQQQLGRDAVEGRDEGSLNFLPPSMQTFQEMDLSFIRTFTEVRGFQGCGPGCILPAGPSACMHVACFTRARAELCHASMFQTCAMATLAAQVEVTPACPEVPLQGTDGDAI